MGKRIPFIPLPVHKIKQIAEHYLGWGESLSKMFPSLSLNLEQSGLDFDPREWTGLALYSGITYFTIIIALIMGTGWLIQFPITKAFVLSVFIGLAIGLGTFIYLIMYPRMLAHRKVKDIEKNLSYALHKMLIHLRSGVPMFNSMVSIARSGYGALSDEFAKAVNEITTGLSEVGALEMLARENPSLHFRRVMWQIVNSMKSGADVSKTLKEIVDNLSVEQRVAIKKYGSELNPLALFYMVLVVIFPTLGIVFLLIISAFVGSFLNLQIILLAILGFLVIVQFMFIGMVKTKRPSGID